MKSLDFARFYVKKAIFIIFKDTTFLLGNDKDQLAAILQEHSSGSFKKYHKTSIQDTINKFFSVIKSHENCKFLLNLDAFVETLDISDFKIIERG